MSERIQLSRDKNYIRNIKSDSRVKIGEREQKKIIGKQQVRKGLDKDRIIKSMRKRFMYKAFKNGTGKKYDKATTEHRIR